MRFNCSQAAPDPELLLPAGPRESRKLRTLAGARRSEAEGIVLAELAEAIFRPRTGDGIVPELVQQSHGSAYRTRRTIAGERSWLYQWKQEYLRNIGRC